MAKQKEQPQPQPEEADPFDALLAEAKDADSSAYVNEEALQTFALFVRGCIDRGIVGKVLYVPESTFPKEQAGNPGWRYKKRLHRDLDLADTFEVGGKTVTVRTKSGPASGDLSKTHKVVGIYLGEPSE